MARARKSPTANPPEITISEVPLTVPNRDKPTGRTLIDLIEEHRPQHPDDVTIPAEEVIGPVGQSVFWTVPLAMLLFGFDVLVHQQYRQDIEYQMIFIRVLKALPAIFILLYTFHPRRAWISVQLLFLTISIVAGCWVVRAVNKQGYYAVMKRTPPLGTLWVWGVVELNLGLALVSCAAVGVYTWWNGFSML
ncbi:hypothetical protein RUND412_006705 [Rhizina undulata]